MGTDALIQIISLIILISMSAFFSSSETALMTVSHFKIRQLSEDNVKNAHTVKKLLDHPATMISTILVGNNIVNIAASSLATIFFTNLFGGSGAIVSTIVMTVVVLVFGEVTPKSLAQKNSEKLSLKVGKTIYFLSKLFAPVIFVLNLITNALTKFLSNGEDIKPVITEDELKTIVDVSEEQGVLKNEETEFINNVLGIKQNQAVDIMTPRTSMIAIDINTPQSELIELFGENTFSRLPVYEDNIDNIIGVLHLKDMVLSLMSSNPLDIRDLIRDPFFAYEYVPIINLFRQMRSNNVSLAIIIDEYGGTSGLISIEDIVEEVVGEIEDEYDDESEIIKISDTEYLVDPELRIDEINEYFDLELESEDFDSIGGFVIEKLGRLPENGDSVTHDNIKFIVEKVDRRKIEELRMIFL